MPEWCCNEDTRFCHEVVWKDITINFRGHVRLCTILQLHLYKIKQNWIQLSSIIQTGLNIYSISALKRTAEIQPWPLRVKFWVVWLINANLAAMIINPNHDKHSHQAVCGFVPSLVKEKQISCFSPAEGLSINKQPQWGSSSLNP